MMKTQKKRDRPKLGHQLAETTASPSQFDFRGRLKALFDSSPLPEDDLLVNLPMYMRSSLLVKLLVLNKLYERIKELPGAILEFGTWWGHNLVVLENLRSIHEPFNKQRKILGFDTFSGYSQVSTKDKKSEVWRKGSYSVGKAYKDYLAELIEVHEGNNVLGHVRGMHELIEGDVRETAPRYFSDHPETLVALAYFDMGLYEPTLAALEAVLPHAVPGAILLFDELTWPEAPGEAIAFKEAFKGRSYRIEKEPLYPSKCIVTVTA